MSLYARAWVKQPAGRSLDALGDVGHWQRWYADPKDVYVWRAEVPGADIEAPEDAMLFIRAVAKAINPEAALSPSMDLDVRGITVGYLEDGTPRIDVVLTADSVTAYVAPVPASAVGTRVLSDAQLRKRYPEMNVEAPQFLQITGPPASVDFWKARPIVWDDQTGPLDAFAKTKNVYKGQADDGPSLEAWKPAEPPPIGPGKDDDDTGRRTVATAAAVGLVATALAFAGATLISESDS